MTTEHQGHVHYTTPLVLASEDYSVARKLVGSLEDLQYDNRTSGACPLFGNLRRQFWPVESTEWEEAFRQPGGPAAHSSLRAGNRSDHSSVQNKKEVPNDGNHIWTTRCTR